MNGVRLKRCCLCAGAALCLLALSGCAGSSRDDKSASPSASRPVIRSLVFAFGPAGAKNVLDTGRGTFTKDMLLGSPLTVPFRLTDDEMARIARKMEEIDFFSYPSAFEPETPSGNHPFPPVGMEPTYRFEVRTDSGTKAVEWTVEWLPSGGRARDLLDLATLIRTIITSKPEYKALPEPEGGYVHLPTRVA